MLMFVCLFVWTPSKRKGIHSPFVLCTGHNAEAQGSLLTQMARRRPSRCGG